MCFGVHSGVHLCVHSVPHLEALKSLLSLEIDVLIVHLCDKVCFLYNRIKVTKPNLLLTVDSAKCRYHLKTQKYIKYKVIMLEIFIAKQYVVVLTLVSQHDH